MCCGWAPPSCLTVHVLLGALDMQLFTGIALNINLLTIQFGMIDSIIAPYLFATALLLFTTALFIFLIEINLSSHALRTHLEDLEEKKNNI